VKPSATEATQPKEGRFRTKIAWGVVDQGASSVTNFGLSILAGRLLGPSGLGVIAVGFSAYLILLGFERSLLAEPAVIASSVEDPEERKRITRNVISANLLMGSLGSFLMAMLGIWIGGRVGRGLVLFSPWLIPALLQDLWRMLLFRDGRGFAAASNDGAWFLGMLLCFPIAWSIRADWALVAWWGLGSSFGALLGLVQLDAKAASPRQGLAWVTKEAWPLGRWFVGEGAIYTAASQFVVFLVAGLLGTQSVGGFRSVQVLFAPFALLGPAIALPGLPAIAGALRQSANAAWRIAFKVTAVLTSLAVGYLLVSLLGGQGLLTFALGRSFGRYGALIWPLGAQQVLAATSGGFYLLLKAARRGKSVLLFRSLISVATIASVSGLAFPFGLIGAAWGMALGTGVGSVCLIIFSWPDSGWRRVDPSANVQLTTIPFVGQ
jgi:O-antigen/teichoic acid export membrane protein